MTIGRSDDNTLVLEDDRASRHHCVIEPMKGNDNSCFQLRDLGSRNGTKLNNKDVDIQPLDNGDVVRIGATEIRFIDPTQTFTNKRSNVPDFKSSMDDLDEPLDSNIPTLDIDLHADAAGSVQTGYERRLREMADGGRERSFDETDISLVDTKGVTLHQATSSGIETGNEDEAGESIRALRLLLFTAFRVRATDLHVEPKLQGSVIRLRVDGYMISAVDISETLFKRLLGLIKILCQIETSQKNTVQDGHFSVAVKGRRVDYRVSLTPSVHGQKLVIRVLDSQNAPSRLHELGCLPWQYEKPPHDRDQGRRPAACLWTHRLRQDHHALFVPPRNRRRAAKRHHHRGPGRVLPGRLHPDPRRLRRRATRSAASFDRSSGRIPT